MLKLAPKTGNFEESSKKSLRNPITFANPLTSAKFGTTTYIYSFRNPQKKLFCGNKLRYRNPFICQNMIKDLSLKTRRLQTLYCALIQSTVWHGNF